MKKSIALILVIFLLVVCSLIALVAFSLLSTGTTSGIDFMQSIQAQAIALGGVDYYLEALENDTDWTDQSDQSSIFLGVGEFDVDVDEVSLSTDSVTFSIISRIDGFETQDIQRQVSLTALKLPNEALFAVFWHRDPGSQLNFNNSSGGTDIVGDYWSRGTSSIRSASSVTSGIAFYAQGENITGAGSYSKEEIQSPYPSIPVFDDSTYETLMSGWNSKVDNVGITVSTTLRSEGSGTLNLSTDTDFGSLPQPVSYRNINTNGHNIIRGTGNTFIVNCRNFNLESGSEIESNVPVFDINCTREFTMTSSQINSSGYTIDCRDFRMNGSSQVDSQNNTINSNRDVIMNDTSQIVNTETLNVRDDVIMNDDSQISADDIIINCRDIFTMNDDSTITANGYVINSNDDFNMNENSSITSNNFEINIYDQFNTNGTTSLTGYGYIVTRKNSGNINIHHANGDSGTFTATPAGGTIYFLSGGTATINSNENDTDVILNSGCVLYSANPGGTDDLLRIRNEDTIIDDATIIAERRLIIEQGADITDSFIFVDRAGNDTTNFLRITGSSTTVTGAIISMGRLSPSLQIRDTAAVEGFVYQYDGVGNKGNARIDGQSTITGALWVRQFYNNAFGPATVTHDLSKVLSYFPEDFPDAVIAEPGSWDDN